MTALTSPRYSKRLIGATAGLALIATGVLGAQSFASGDDNSTDPPAGPPGEPVIAGDELVLESEPIIQTSGANWDPTIVTKYISATGFAPYTGVGFVEREVDFNDRTCFNPDVAAGGTNTRLIAPVELPDGARIERLTFFGEDSSGAYDINVRLHRQEFSTMLAVFPNPAVTSHANTIVDVFSTSGDGGVTIVSGADNLEELTGSPFTGFLVTGSSNRFHTVEVDLRNAAGNDHVLCGVRVDYQVAAPTDPGTVFHPVDSYRAFDSRQPSFGALSGPLGPNETKVIDITDGYDSAGVAIPAQDNVVPASATAVAYNITIAGADGPNFVAVTTGDAASFTASAINYSAGSNVANGSTVTVAADQTIKLWGGDNTGSSHVLIDIVGYYSAPVPPNMAN